MKSNKITSFLQLFEKDKYNQQPKKEAAIVKNTLITEEFERCVLCGELTSVLISTPINLRENYEVGCGQVCRFCKQKLHISKKGY